MLNGGTSLSAIRMAGQVSAPGDAQRHQHEPGTWHRTGLRRDLGTPGVSGRLEGKEGGLRPGLCSIAAGRACKGFGP